eukprot:CAMPEP_0206504596 /NCGR_PEP_ID=MMETSP0324_2-20121206/55590_1 /ASSEMBLY_ACC=CAM_ASM_000836 /TAXON_ID=2866 /ORGANISM="Crypthecodinium cohnii, Strain Seligo" /LENGTH=244 /DNA_ID=CAMNT_0053993817 /DNA_START=205 /DNA_END=937 /DNA_ORIENTATION=+
MVVEALGEPGRFLETCPAATLQACLMKANARLLAEGTLTKEDMTEWPLMEALDHLEATVRSLETNVGPLRSAMVMNFCSAKDRLGNMHELEWILLPPFGDPARRHEFPGVTDGDYGLLTETDLYIYLVNATKCEWLPDSVIEEIRPAVKSLHLIPYTGGPTREEQSAYFKFMSDHYDDLHDFIIFVHPDSPEHQGVRFNALKKALTVVRSGSQLAVDSLKYYPLSQQLLINPRRTWSSTYAPQW